MIIKDQYQAIIVSALASYAQEPNDYSVRRGTIYSSEFEDTKYGFWPEIAEEYIEQISSGDMYIDDEYVNDILSISLTYKTLINDYINYSSSSAEDISEAKSDRKTMNSLIRFLKKYASDNNIALPCLDEEDEDDILPPLYQ